MSHLSAPFICPQLELPQGTRRLVSGALPERPGRSGRQPGALRQSRVAVRDSVDRRQPVVVQSALRAREYWSQHREIILRVLTHNIYDSQTDGFLQSRPDPFSDLAIDTFDPCSPLVNSWCSIATALASWALRYCFLRRPRSSGIVANPARPASNIVFGSGTAPTEDSGVPCPQSAKRMFRSS